MRILRVAGFLTIRSLLRGNAGVTLMSIAMVMVVFVSVSFLPSLIAGAVAEVNQQVVNTLTGDLTLLPSNKPTLGDAKSYLKKVNGAHGVVAATGLRRVASQIAHGSSSSAWSVDAIDPKTFSRVFSTPAHLVSGRFLTEHDLHGIVLGVGIAGDDMTSLRSYPTSFKTVHVGDKVTVTLLNGRTATFTVRGIYFNQFAASDSTAYVTTAAADALSTTADYAGNVRKMFAALDSMSSSLSNAAGGASALAQQSGLVSGAATTIANNASVVALRAGTLTAGAGALNSSMTQLDSRAADLAASAAALSVAATQLATQLGSAISASAHASSDSVSASAADIASLAATCPASDPAFCAQLGTSSAALTTAAAKAASTAALIDAASGSATSLAAAASQLASATSQLEIASHGLAESTTTVQGGTSSLSAGSVRLHSGAQRAAAAAVAISSGANELAAQLGAGAAQLVPGNDKDEQALLSLLSNASRAPGPDTVTSVTVRAVPGTSLATLESRLGPLSAGVRFESPSELSSSVQSEIDTFNLIDQIMRVISLLVAAITVFIITYVDLTNRRRQIGIERAIGIRPAAIVGTYVLKAMITAVLGTLLGALVFRAVLVPLFDRYPFIFPTGPVSLLTTMTATLQTMLLLFVVAVVSALVPAVRSVRLRILDAIWGT